MLAVGLPAVRLRQKLVAHYQRGHIEESRAGLEQADTYSAQIEQQLQKMERASR